MPTLRRAAVMGLLALVGVVSANSAARAQAQPPPVTSPPPTGDATGAPPAAAPSANAAPVTPLPSTLAPDPAPAPPLQLTQRTAYEPPPPQPEPFYRQWWFWGAVGVVAATVAVILVWNLGSNDSGPPSTTFGNMHAF